MAGVSGVGKSTLAQRIAELGSLPYTEIDSHYHGPDWTPRPEFLSEMDEFTAASSWVTEWQYTLARPMLSARADTLVWLDLPRRVSLTRVVRRTIRRSRTREELWNGNVEPGIQHALFDREGIIRWSVRTYRDYATSVPALKREHPQLQLVRLRSQREVDVWLAGPLRAALAA